MLHIPPISIDLMTVRILCEVYRLWSSSLCSIF